jgi:hypothetical protein
MISTLAQRIEPIKNRMSNRCRIQYVSDIHLDHMEKCAFPQILRPAARILVLAGDIGNPHHRLYSSFLDWCHDKWDHVFIVAGNHELYNFKSKSRWPTMDRVFTYDQQLKACADICSTWSNIHFLNNSNYYLQDYNVEILGTTLWSNIPRDKYAEVLHGMNDYNYIAKGHPIIDIQSISPDDTNAWHKAAVQWLDAQIFRCEEERRDCVVVSHHLPSYSLCNPKFAGHPVNCCFASTLDDRLKTPVRAWICGHSHHQVELRVQHDDPPTREGEVILALNAYGYNSVERAFYNPEKVLSFACGPWPAPQLY